MIKRLFSRPQALRSKDDCGPMETNSQAVDYVGFVEVVQRGQVVGRAELLRIDGMDSFRWQHEVLANIVPSRKTTNSKREPAAMVLSNSIGLQYNA